MTNQKATGNIVVDSISKLTMNLANGSSFSAAIHYVSFLLIIEVPGWQRSGALFCLRITGNADGCLL